MLLVLVIDLKDSVLYVDNAERSLACVWDYMPKTPLNFEVKLQPAA